MKAGSNMIRAVAMTTMLALLSACAQDVDMASLRARIGDDSVIMLSTSTCGYCRQLRTDLAAWNIEYRDIDVEKSRDGQFAYESLEGRGVPILLVGDRTVHGYSPQRTRALLAAAGLMPESGDP